MASSHAPVFVLDVGRVCIALHLQACADQLGFACIDELHQRHPAVAPLALALESGQLADADFIAAVADELQQPPPRVQAAWLSIIGNELPGIAEVVATARAANLAVVLLSDTSAMHAAKFEANLSFRNDLAGTVYSHEVGACKPAAAMYGAVESTFCDNRPPLLFADDKPKNLAAAAARNWPTCEVRNYDLAPLQTALARAIAAK